MRLVYVNPNSTDAMTQSVVAVARSAASEATVSGVTNDDGPSSIQGFEDGLAAVPGMLTRLSDAAEGGADVIVIACFDDTGLAEARQVASCPVLGIGQASYLAAALLGQRFSVVTSTAASVPVIEGNIDAQGFGQNCVSVRASGLPVLTIEEGRPETLDILTDEIKRALADGAETVVLGCAGMAHLRAELAMRTGARLIDGVAASAVLAVAAAALALQ
ncbi:HyuE hydantoin racemase [Silicimonas algicola]|uniref:Allantoin racemase n=1 Tax=Silicimonas algicola TaxID=1826607 RepID=A0A316G6Z9_9RHOB|nr:aspartate/glutamate racemase family protein [Silicimonas algicola]AZQ69370.1 HyuE hydantoin racemase [Silicimonas algicola]PWK56433.1 allantoin racemase [Silicimonas algicola]